MNPSTVHYFVACVIFLLPLVSAKAPVFGTESGYDAGGSDPICWRSRFDMNSSGIEPNNIESMNQGLKAVSDSIEEDTTDAFSTATVQMLRGCAPGTEFQVVHQAQTEENSIVMGELNKFLITLRLNLTAVNSNINVTDLDGKSRVFFRLVLCDAVKLGFCNPLDQLEVEELTPSRTDQTAADGDDEDIVGEDRWQYNQTSDVLLGISDDEDDGRLVFSRWVRWTLRELEEGNEVYETNVTISMVLPQDRTLRGVYFFIAHAVVSFNIGSGTYERIDIADAIPDNVVRVDAPPAIQYVSDKTTWIVAVMIALCGSLALFVFVYIILKRNHAVMRLTQGAFLAGLAAACFIDIVFTFTALPLNDFFCALREPMLHIPITLMGSIMVGRIWRVYETISPVSILGKVHPESIQDGCTKSWHAGFDDFVVGSLTKIARLTHVCQKKQAAGQRRASIRRVVTAQETVCLVLILFLPQVIFQVVSATTFDTGIVIELTENGENGREVCQHRGGRWIALVGLFYAALINILAMYVAWIARNLPSAFNEKDQVFLSSILCCGITFVSLALLEISDQPTTSPDVEVFLRAFLTLGCSMTVLMILIWPKIRRVMSGEKVVLSHALAADIRSSDVSTSDGNSHAMNGRRSTLYVAGSPIKLKGIEPLPRDIEIRTMEVQSLLRSVIDQNSQGRPLTADQWKKFQVDIARLKGELDRVDYAEFDSSDQPDFASEPNRISV